MKHFTQVSDVDDIDALVERAREFKKSPHKAGKLGRERTLILLFFNPSLRTRLSTETAALKLGLSVLTMNAAQGWKLEFADEVVMDSDRAEHIREAAAVISQYGDIIGIRTFPTLTDREQDYQDRVLNSFIKYASVPVISLESAIRHPLQSLTDVMTIEEYKKNKRPRIVLSWAPHPKALPQAVANSFAEWMRAVHADLVITHPEGYDLAPEFVGNTPVEQDQQKALAGADFVYTKNWSSYQYYGEKLIDEKQWMITPEKMALTNDAYFMHCLPVRRNVVVADAVIDSPQSLVIPQAGNRQWAAQAVLEAMLKSL